MPDADDDHPLGGERVQWAVLHYQAVHLATGMLIARLDISQDEALLRLRAYAFSHQLPITEVAEAVVNGRLRFDRSLE
ncbi:ANTAR domain-containing protein [Amycolatopsis japonica]|uniref:ANTAR domain-containing protein n=1 Tax=Amycolatopsis japonica TaxID=208439 RepID=UPI0036716BBC